MHRERNPEDCTVVQNYSIIVRNVTPDFVITSGNCNVKPHIVQYKMQIICLNCWLPHLLGQKPFILNVVCLRLLAFAVRYSKCVSHKILPTL